MKKEMIECYQDYKTGKENLDNCCNRIVEIVFKNPHYFQIGNLRGDLKSKLILLLLSSLKSVFKKYDENYGSFITYISATIKGLKTRCFREYYRNKVAEQAEYEYYRNSFSQYSYTDPLDLIIAEKKPVEYTKTKNSKNTYLPKKKNLDTSKKILVLTLKSAHFLKESHIKKIAKYTNCELKQLETMCDLVKDSIKSRCEKYSNQKEKINHEYMLKNRCSFELKQQEKNTAMYEKSLKAYNFHSNRWNNLIKQKRKPSYLCPTNHKIAEILNISEDQVHYVLHKFGNKKIAKNLLT